MSGKGSNFDGLSVLAGSIDRLTRSRKAIMAMQQKHAQPISTSEETSNESVKKRNVKSAKRAAKRAKTDHEILAEKFYQPLGVRAESNDNVALFPNGKKVLCYHEGNPLKLYAVRKGKTVQKCIFFHWEDCKKEVLGCDSAVYSAFDDLLSAAAFVFSNDDEHRIFGSILNMEEDIAGASISAQSATEAAVIRKSSNQNTSGDFVDTSDEEYEPNRKASALKRKRKSTNESDNQLSEADLHKKMRERMRDWIPLYQKLKKYYEEHGDCKNVDMYYFIEVQGKMYRKYCENKKHGKKTDPIAEEKIRLLNEINFDFESTKINLKWMGYYEKAKKYKKENPDFIISNTHELKAWVTFQREDFKRLRLGKPNTMTIEKLQKLNEMGFPFNKKDRQTPWEERRVQLKEFKKKHGHLKVPLSHPVLGNYCTATRKRYWTGKLNAERAEELKEMGFVFQASKRHINSDQSGFKSWDERFEEVVEYKRRFGNCLVPQHWKENPTLGGWVAKQRKGYRLRKDGKKCNWLTPERALKLAEIGFVFDYTGGRGRRRVNHDNHIIDSHDNNNIIQNVHVNDESEVEDYEW